MLAIDVELLTGRYVATRFNDRTRVEWPPHPARLFSAAVAAWADIEEPSSRERQALKWWEELGAPEITCSWGDQWSERAPVTHYVPVNDTQIVGRDTSETYRRLRLAATDLIADTGVSEKTTKQLRARLAKVATKATQDSLRVATAGIAPLDALKVLPGNRERQGRVYPTAIPGEALVTYTWPDIDEDDELVAVLDDVLSRVARLGHSSSLVAVAVQTPKSNQGPEQVSSGTAETNSRAKLTPTVGGRLPVRVAGPGQLALLEKAFTAHQAVEPRTLPAEIVTYAPAGPPVEPLPSSVFGSDWIVVEPIKGRFEIRDTLALTRTLRLAVMHHSPAQPAPEIITGHLPGPTGERTAPTNRAHLAIAALPFVSYAHADGSVQGLALIVPRSATSEERTQVLQAIGRWLTPQGEGGGGGQLRLGGRGVAAFRRSATEEAPVSARQARWSRPATRWCSVTPVALDRHAGALNDRDRAKREAAMRKAEDVVRIACRHVGLPDPEQVVISTAPLVRGTQKVHSFPPYAVKGGRLRRALVHVELTFGEPIAGPVLIGAGRYLGYGLFVPAPDPARGSGDRG